MRLSIVVPAHRQASTIARNVRDILGVVGALPIEHELIVVVDGEVDQTRAAVVALGEPAVTVLAYPENRGKGFAVRHGFQAATGEIVGFIDAGGDIAPEGLVRAVTQLLEGSADVVVGSKRHPESRVQYPPLRRAYSAVYQGLIWVLFGLNVSDTQAGLKVFRREVIARTLPLLTVNRYAFDVELLAVARMLGFGAIEEAPVDVRLVFPSSVDGRAVFVMLRDTLNVFLRLRLLRQYQRQAAARIAP